MMIRLVYLDIFECNYVKYTYGPTFFAFALLLFFCNKGNMAYIYDEDSVKALIQWSESA